MAADREIKLTGKYLLIPIATNDAKIRPGKLKVSVGDVLIFSCGAKTAASEDQIAWWAHIDLSEYKGKIVKISHPNSKFFMSSDEIKNTTTLYQEKGRPQIHFSQMRGWNNDTNGMVYYDGEYHLMWQANPTGNRMGNQMWGHAVSKDLVNWQQLPLALRGFGKGVEKRHPSMADGACYSGSAFVDHNNTLGKQKGDVKTIVAAFTDTALGESLAYSTDKGRTFTIMREHNPVYTHKKIGRDPKVIWHEPTKSWVMVVFAIKEGARNRGMQFLVSKDLLKWEETCFVKGFNECPEFF
jgi:fructan beta-fructosidase